MPVQVALYTHVRGMVIFLPLVAPARQITILVARCIDELVCATSGGGGFGDRDDRPERRGFADRDRDDRSQHSDDGPSRADAADSWAGASKFTPSSAADDRRGGGFGDREPRRSGFNDR